DAIAEIIARSIGNDPRGRRGRVVATAREERGIAQRRAGAHRCERACLGAAAATVDTGLAAVSSVIEAGGDGAEMLHRAMPRNTLGVPEASVTRRAGRARSSAIDIALVPVLDAILAARDGDSRGDRAGLRRTGTASDRDDENAMKQSHAAP